MRKLKTEPLSTLFCYHLFVFDGNAGQIEELWMEWSAVFTAARERQRGSLQVLVETGEFSRWRIDSGTGGRESGNPNFRNPNFFFM